MSRTRQLTSVLVLLACACFAPLFSRAGAQTSAATRVWLNAASKVYHCEGTRWYGATKSGRYLSEDSALVLGNRAAGGKACGPTSAKPSALAALSAVAPDSLAGVRVWINPASRVYHCPGARWYGKTARGEYATEAAAMARGNRAAGGKRCG